jgi:hypothetical protein
MDVVAPDTCAMVLEENQLTIKQFFAYNPAVGADCANLWLGYRYCVRTPDYTPPTTASTTIPPPTSTAPPNAPAPTFSGIPSNCNLYHMVQTGDSCASLEDEYFITDAQFHSWNPAVSTDCAENFWQGKSGPLMIEYTYEIVLILYDSYVYRLLLLRRYQLQHHLAQHALSPNSYCLRCPTAFADPGEQHHLKLQ